MLVERGAATVALARLVERDRESLERQTHRTLLTGVIAGSVPLPELVARASALGVPLEGHALVAVLVRLNRGPIGPALEAQERLRDFAETVADARARQPRRWASSAASTTRPSACCSRSRRARTSTPRSNACRRRSPSGRRRARAVLPAAGWVMAVGSVVADVRDVRRAFLEAAQVADAAPSDDDAAPRPYYRLPDVRLRGLLHLLRDDDRLQTFVERELGPLLAHDAQHGSDLVGVLRGYLAAGRNKSAAADAAHMSRPTLLRAAAPIEQVLAVDLDSVESCLSLHVALLGLDAIRR